MKTKVWIEVPVTEKKPNKAGQPYFTNIGLVYFSTKGYFFDGDVEWWLEEQEAMVLSQADQDKIIDVLEEIQKDASKSAMLINEYKKVSQNLIYLKDIFLGTEKLTDEKL